LAAGWVYQRSVEGLMFGEGSALRAAGNAPSADRVPAVGGEKSKNGHRTAVRKMRPAMDFFVSFMRAVLSRVRREGCAGGDFISMAIGRARLSTKP